MTAALPRARVALDLAPALALAAAVLLLAWVVIFWGWRWAAPAPEHVIPAEPRNPLAAIVASGWLAAENRATTGAPVTSTLSGDVRLMGVFAEADGGGYALFHLPTGAKLVRKGGVIADGSTLVDIAPWTIRIRDAGGERSIALLPSSPRGATAAQPPTRIAAPSRRSLACAPPPGFSGQVVKLNAELLQGLATQPDALRAIVTPVAGGGMSVRDGSGFAQMIGLKPGDRVRLANGIPLRSADDVLAAVLTPLIANQQVRLSGTRDGHAREMLLQNAGTCPG
ncbi:MAG: hypothetical protein ABI440_00040 [Casimicrobiaceae bacterium]